MSKLTRNINSLFAYGVVGQKGNNNKCKFEVSKCSDNNFQFWKTGGKNSKSFSWKYLILKIVSTEKHEPALALTSTINQLVKQLINALALSMRWAGFKGPDHTKTYILLNFLKFHCEQFHRCIKVSMCVGLCRIRMLTWHVWVKSVVLSTYYKCLKLQKNICFNTCTVMLKFNICTVMLKCGRGAGL